MKELKQFSLFMGAILATGLVLNAAGTGMLGSTAQGIATKVTEGYGV